MSKIFVIGNSHLRGLNNNDLIAPFFIGSASDYSLLNPSIKNVYLKIDKFFNEIILNENDFIFLFFGEAVCRYSLINDYYPHKVPISKYKQIYKKEMITQTNSIIEDGITNYIKLYNYISQKHQNTYILSATTAFSPIINKVKYFNKVLKSKVVKYVSIFEETLDDNDNIKNEFLNYNFKNETVYPFYKTYEYDPIHMSNNLSYIFMKNIKNLIKNIKKFDSSKYDRNNKYKCFMI